MSSFRYFIEGLGTASGFCWPAYGFIVGTLALCGITTAIITAGITCGVFLVVCPFVALVLYKKNKNEDEKLKLQIHQNQIEMNNLISDYLLILTRIYHHQQKILKKDITDEDLHHYLLENINIDFTNESQLNLYIANNIFNPNQSDSLRISLTPSIQETKDTIKNQLPFNPSFSFHRHCQNNSHRLSKWNKFTTGMLGFMCGIGSAAGSCAGIISPLLALGILTAATVPIIGTIALAVGLICGCIIARIYIRSEIKKNEINYVIGQMNSNIISLKHKIVDHNNIHKLDLEWEKRQTLEVGLKEAKGHELELQTQLSSKNALDNRWLKRRKQYHALRLFPPIKKKSTLPLSSTLLHSSPREIKFK